MMQSERGVFGALARCGSCHCGSIRHGAMARRAGFDEVEISPHLARRQPQEAWVFRADWRAHDYQNRLRGE